MIQDDRYERRIKRSEQRRAAGRSGKNRIFSGLLLIVIGRVILLQKMNAPFPQWIFTWPVFLITAGLFMGIRKKFSGPGWIMAILVGGVFLAGNMHPEWDLQKYSVPIFLIAAGIVFMFRPRHDSFSERFRHGRYGAMHNDYSAREPFTQSFAEGETNNEMLDVVSVLGGTKKIIFSKDFQGGEVTSFLGGTELNLSQADINGRVVLELTQVLGGTKLIVPTHWDIRPELVSIFGGIEDKRRQDVVIDPSKILVLKGTSVFGGIEIRNY